jgi:signal transduction histidine kinase
MAERAELLNGLLDLSSTPGSGTAVVFEVNSG